MAYNTAIATPANVSLGNPSGQSQEKDSTPETVTRKKGTRMSEEEIQQAVITSVTDAKQYLENELETFRAKASDYYMGMPFGNEEEGRSQAVITIVRDTIHGILPSLLRVFFGGERYVEFRPRNMSQVEWADQATAFIADVVVMQDNDGFHEMYSWFKDALLKRIGIATWYHDETTVVKSYQVTAYGIDEITRLLADSANELDEDSVEPSKLSTPGNQLWDFSYTRTANHGKNKFFCVPPDEFLYTRGARNPLQAQMLGHQCEKTRSELLAMGISEEDIDEYAYKDAQLEMNPEEISRQKGSQMPGADEGLPEPNRKAYYAEIYPYLDVDGDGYAELVKICILGPTLQVVQEPVPVDERPFAILCPDPEPHAIEGLGIADYTMDMQKIVSMIVRAMHDSLALAVTNRLIYVEGLVSRADVMNTEIGAPIRSKDLNGVREIAHSFLGGQALPVLQYWDDVLKKRTGVINGTNGLGADALQSTTASAVNAAVQDAQAQIEMIARIFAETGVKQLMRGLLRLTIQHPEPDRVMRMRGKWVPVNPEVWDAELDVAVNVALGTGSLPERISVLTDTADRQKEILATLGPSNPMVSLNDYRMTLVKRLEMMGRKDAEQYFRAVPENWTPPPPPPDPNQQIAQAEMAKAQAQVAKTQADVAAQAAETQLAAERAQVEEMRRAMDLQLKREEMHLIDERERDRIEVDSALRIEQMTLQYASQQEATKVAQTVNALIADQKAQLEHTRTAHDTALRALELAHKAPAAAGAGQEAPLAKPSRRRRKVKIEHDPSTGRPVSMDITDENA